MSLRSLKLASLLIKSKLNHFNYSNIMIYSSIINEVLLYSSLKKYANSPKFLAFLDTLNPSDEIRAYILSLPEAQMKLAATQLSNNKNISKSELENIVNNTKVKSKEVKKDLSKDIPSNLPNNIRNWFVIQIKKHPSKAESLINNLEIIVKFTKDYNQDIFNFDANSIFQILKQEDILKESIGEEGEEDPRLNMFFNKVLDQENLAIALVDINTAVWARRQFLEIKREWQNNIKKYMKKMNKSFSDILNDGRALMIEHQEGRMRGMEMPHSPLNDPDHSNLMNKLPFINDYIVSHLNDDERILNLSLQEMIKKTDEWHRLEAAKGGGKGYDPIDSSNIVYGPNNWKDEENKGYFILELKSDNDLKTEGFKMNHCVGSYCDRRRSGELRIFSLRHNSASTTPIITIETDPTGGVIRQDYGTNNSKIEKRFHNMIDEWNSTAEVDIDRLSDADFNKLMKTTNKLSMFERVFGDPKKYEHSIKYALKNKNCPKKFLIKAITQSYNDKDDINNADYILQSVENIPADVFDMIFENPIKYQYIMTSAIKNKYCPERWLVDLVKKNNLLDIQYMFRRENIPIGVFETIFRDMYKYEYSMPLAFSHKDCPVKCLISAITQNNKKDIYNANMILSYVKNIPVEVFKIIISDKNISKGVGGTLSEKKLPDEFLALIDENIELNDYDKYHELARLLINNKDNKEFVSKFRNSTNHELKLTSRSLDPDTTGEELDELLSDYDIYTDGHYTLYNILSNPNLLPKTFVTMFKYARNGRKEYARDIYDKIMKNISCPSDVFIEIMKVPEFREFKASDFVSLPKDKLNILFASDNIDDDLKFRIRDKIQNDLEDQDVIASHSYSSLYKLAEEFETLESVPISTDERTKDHSPLSIKPTVLNINQHPTLLNVKKPHHDTKSKIDSDGSKKFYDTEGRLHRIGGPAVISPDGNQLYYFHGNLHRTDGPAAIFFNGTQRWFSFGKSLSPVEVFQLLLNIGTLSVDEIDILKELADKAFFDSGKLDLETIKYAGSILLEKGIIANMNTNTISEFLKAAEQF